MSADPDSIALSLISHTNAGKTTLARTLLGRDVGDVRDAAHVTVEAAVHTMIETESGDRLSLWDTPGFGDSARLARRLAQQGNPIGWFLTQVWDRFADRPLWLSQQAVRNVRDHADVVLYLVNASEDPVDTGYIAPEMTVLEWIGKPVVALLNQTGRPRPHSEEAADEARWRTALGAHEFVKAVLTLDAFARCWVQEITLLRTVGSVLPTDRQAVFARLADAWQARRMGQFRASMDAIAQPIARAACDRLAIPESGLRGTLREIGKAIGVSRNSAGSGPERAMLTLAERVDRDLRASTDQLIAINELEGRAAGDVLARLAQSVTTEGPVSEGKAAVVGGFLSGALSGLVADLASGGLTLGAGMLAGGLLGALGGAGLARGYNIARGTEETVVRWSNEFLDNLVNAALLRYLAVAHYGRGRGEWTETESPAFWREIVAHAVAEQRAALDAAWNARSTGDATAVVTRLTVALEAAARDVLRELYPGTLEAPDRAGG